MPAYLPVENVQILNFPTPFRTSQYLTFSTSESTLKAHRKISNICKKFLDQNLILVIFKELIPNSKDLFFDCFQFHALEKALLIGWLPKRVFSGNYVVQEFVRFELDSREKLKTS